MNANTPTVLIVDDSPVNLGVVVETLERHGYEVLIALDGEEALQRAASVVPDIILLDVMMPGLDGFEVCRRLKAQDATRDIPVIFMTALAQTEDKLKGFHNGGVDYVTKPMQVDEVKARVDAHVKLRALQRQLEEQNLALQQEVLQRKQAQAALRKSRDLLRTLAIRQERQHENDRRDIVNNIHEDLGQNLSALRMTLAVLEISNENEQLESKFAEMQDIIDRSIIRIRDMVTMLRPVALDGGIVVALRWLVQDFRHGMGLRFHVDIDEEIRLEDGISTFVFRAAQEILINATLHGAARNIRLTLATTGDVCSLIVEDDGCGFDPSAQRAEDAFGLSRISEQAFGHGGVLIVDSAPGRGAKVELRVPVEAEPPCGPADIGTPQTTAH